MFPLYYPMNGRKNQTDFPCEGGLPAAARVQRIQTVHKAQRVLDCPGGNAFYCCLQQQPQPHGESFLSPKACHTSSP